MLASLLFGDSDPLTAAKHAPQLEDAWRCGLEGERHMIQGTASLSCQDEVQASASPHSGMSSTVFADSSSALHGSADGPRWHASKSQSFAWHTSRASRPTSTSGQITVDVCHFGRSHSDVGPLRRQHCDWTVVSSSRSERRSLRAACLWNRNCAIRSQELSQTRSSPRVEDADVEHACSQLCWTHARLARKLGITFAPSVTASCTWSATNIHVQCPTSCDIVPTSAITISSSSDVQLNRSI